MVLQRWQTCRGKLSPAGIWGEVYDPQLLQYFMTRSDTKKGLKISGRKLSWLGTFASEFYSNLLLVVRCDSIPLLFREVAVSQPHDFCQLKGTAARLKVASSRILISPMVTGN